MLNQLVNKFMPTAKVLHIRWDHKPIFIPPVLYHGTNSAYLTDNTHGGVYSSPYKEPIYTVANSFGAIDRASNSKLFPSEKPKTSKLLVIGTYASLRDIIEDKPNTPQMVTFRQLLEDNYETVDLKVPEGEDFYNLGKILEINRENIESAIKRMLGLKSRVTMESIYPQN